MIKTRFTFEAEGLVTPKFSLALTSKRVLRATEQTLDKVAHMVYLEQKVNIPRIFDRPTPYTLNSLEYTPTKNHNMQASVWFKEPDRMIQHYLVPQVEGGLRKMKGFERALNNKYLYPAAGARMDKYGNMPYGQIVQILSVLGRAEYMAGVTANVSARSRKRNRKPREYFWAKSAKVHLAAGVYERQKRTIRPVLAEGRRPKYRKRYSFYEIGQRVVDKNIKWVFAFYMNTNIIAIGGGGSARISLK